MISLDVATNAIVHEMRQPLFAIAASGSAGLKWLARQPPRVDEAQDNFENVVKQARRAEDILDSVRGLFNGSANQAPILVEDVVEQVLKLLAHDLQASGVPVQKDYASVRLRVMADPVRLQQVVLNLVKNAIDAMDAQAPSTRRLAVTTRRQENSIVLQVDDSGPGIAAGAHDRIFDPFFTTKPNGMGLGLAICRQIVEAHGGSLILAKSGRLGTSFQIELPIAKVMPG
jgi:C4-dicarboxylate-specific signal transduction histidine kinase